MLSDTSLFEKRPYVNVSADASACDVGWNAIASQLRRKAGSGRFVLCLECYPGVFLDPLLEVFEQQLLPDLVLRSEDAFFSPKHLQERLAPFLTSDPVFGRMNDFGMEDFFDPAGLAHLRHGLAQSRGLTIVAGPGASIVEPSPGLLVYADLARWEIQQRQRRCEIGNLGAQNTADPPSLKYKRAFFVDWRAADRLKTHIIDKIDFLLDTNDPAAPKMISGSDFRSALADTVRQPFSVVPFFDPGPWGGQWMKRRFGLPEDAPNYAWCFNCVPEENSLLLGFGSHRIEIPAINVVLRHPLELLGIDIFSRFGVEFPIRFDFLDTMGGGNLSLQVHPLADYIREHFGMNYTQEESYYVVDCAPEASVFLGMKEGAAREEMERDLRLAQSRGAPFPVERYVNRWPARKHDHFLIPPGTIHCSGANCLVLEVSATPYIFTFKLWDWGRLGLNGEPRPIHLDHGLANIRWDRTTRWVREQLVNRVESVRAGPGWTEERTGLHETQFIETRRHWFTGPVAHDTAGTVNVICLVEGESAVVESPTNDFPALPIRYAETFIVPAAVGRYTIHPISGLRHATLKACVRPR